LWELTKQKTVIPFDEYFGLDILPFKLSCEMMLEIAFIAQNQGSYEAAQHMLARNGYFINDDTIRQVANFVGSYIFLNDLSNAVDIKKLYNKGNLDFKFNKKGILYLETDGAAINTRIKNKDDSTWRENKLAIAFNTDNIRYWKNKKTGELDHNITRKEYSSFIGSVNTFKYLTFCLAIKNGYGQFTNTVIISDGATWIRHMVDELFPDAQHILDFYHLAEKVHAFSKIHFIGDDKKQKKWADKICDDLRESKTDDVLTIIDKLQKNNTNSLNLSQYIQNNIYNVNYKEYRSKNYFIGSGAIESGNKSVLQSRMKRPGQRWDAHSAQNLLTLKAKQESGLWVSEVCDPFRRLFMQPPFHRFDGFGRKISIKSPNKLIEALNHE
jgi:hypothetical protein